MTWMLIWFNWSATTINDMLKILDINIIYIDMMNYVRVSMNSTMQFPLKKKNPIILTKSKLISLSLCVCVCFLKKKKKKV